MDVASILGTLGTLATGPLGGAAIKFIAEKVGVPSGDTVEIAKTLEQWSPEMRASLNGDLQKWIISEQNRMIEAHLADVQDARATKVEIAKSGNGDNLDIWMFGLALLVVLGVLWGIWRSPDISEFLKGVVTLILGLPWRSRVTGNKGSVPERELEKRLPHPRMAAGAQITQSRHGEVVTIGNNAGPQYVARQLE